MHPRTFASLANLRGRQWFRNVGVRDTDAADVVSSWDEAIAGCSSMEWENLCLEAANHYREQLVERAPREFSRWNEVVSYAKPAARALVREKTRTVIDAHQLPEVFLHAVHWDILHHCMEAEFADIYPPGYYTSQAYWYAHGHFPCGWRGPFPDGGKLVIY